MFVIFYGKEDGKKEMIKREIATFRKSFGEGNLESSKIVLLFIIRKKRRSFASIVESRGTSLRSIRKIRANPPPPRSHTRRRI